MSKHNLYDRRWRKRREQQLRNEPLCRLCKQMRGIVTAATVADHITPHGGDPEIFQAPLQILCERCRDLWEQQQEMTGHIRGYDLHGNRSTRRIVAPEDRDQVTNVGSEAASAFRSIPCCAQGLEHRSIYLSPSLRPFTASPTFECARLHRWRQLKTAS